jgi:putative hemolysin
MKILPLPKAEETPVTEEEIRVLLEQATQAGAFGLAEQEMIDGVFRLANRRANELMTPCNKVVWPDLNADAKAIAALIAQAPHSRFPVCDGALDSVIGIVHVKNLFSQTASGHPLNARAVLQKPLFVPEGHGLFAF